MLVKMTEFGYLSVETEWPAIVFVRTLLDCNEPGPIFPNTTLALG